MRGKFFMTFLAAIMAAHATPRLAPPSVNLGRFDADTPPEAVFTLSNPDGEPCPVSRVRTGCPCVTASADRDEIPPGGSAAVTVAPKAGALSSHDGVTAARQARAGQPCRLPQGVARCASLGQAKGA